MYDFHGATSFSRISIIVLRLGDRNHIRRIAGKSQTKIICLNITVALAVGPRIAGHDAPQQTAVGIPFLQIWIHPVRKLMLGSHLGAVAGFAVLRIGLAAGSITYACPGQKIAFIGTIDEYLGLHSKRIGVGRGRVFKHDSAYSVSVLPDRNDAPVHHRGAAVLFKESAEDSMRHFRLKCQLQPVLAVMPRYTGIELTGTAFQNLIRMIEIGPAESSGSHAADTASGLYEHHTLTGLPDCACRGDACGSGAVDTYVSLHSLH